MKQRASRVPLYGSLIHSKRAARKITKRLWHTARKSVLLRKAYQPVRKYALRRSDPGQRIARAIDYSQWIADYEPRIWVNSESVRQSPLISVLVPTYNTPEKYLKPLIESLIAQDYSTWELCVADGSTDALRATAIQDACMADPRIKYIALKENRGIVGNTNEALKLATGEFVAFLDHDDTLAPQALLEVVSVIQQHNLVDLIYSDEDKLSDDGTERSLPFFKPDWSPAMEEGVNYMTHFLVVRHSIIDVVGGLRDGFEGAQDYDFILRLTDATKQIVHIPKILYHWRTAEGSTSGPIENKQYADTAGQRALAEHVKRQNIKGTVLAIPELPTNYRIKYKIPSNAKASIIIPFKDKPELLKTCLTSILKKTTFPNYEIILLSNNSVEVETHSYLKSLAEQPHIKVFYWDHPFNYSALNNFGRKKASGDYLVLLNNDTEVISNDWLDELIGVAAQPGVGSVGPRLLYPNDKIQHAGIILGMGTMAGHVFKNLPEDALTAFGRPYWPRNYLAVTAACLCVATKKFDEVHGMDEQFIMAGNDVAFGITLYEKGYLNVYWPFVQLYHYENVSVGSYNNAPPGDYDHSLTYYKKYLNWHDPYFNPNLDLMNEQIGLRNNYE
jgi:glycosyltransferase involved in cell wall biosynthesis